KELLSDDYVSPPKPRDRPNDQEQSEPDQDQTDQKRYVVKDAAGQTITSKDTLAQAHQAWKDRTNQDGSIIDTRTGKDVTPEKDDDGQFADLDDQGKQFGSYQDFDQAVEAWKELTESKGKIVDVPRKLDVTPRSEN